MDEGRAEHHAVGDYLRSCPMTADVSSARCQHKGSVPRLAAETRPEIDDDDWPNDHGPEVAALRAPGDHANNKL
jgi:hypothetical protein